MRRLLLLALTATASFGCIAHPHAQLSIVEGVRQQVTAPVVCGPMGFRKAPLQARWGEYVRVTVQTAVPLRGSVLLHANGQTWAPRAWSTDRDGTLVLEARFENLDPDARFALARERPIDVTLSELEAPAGGSCEGAIFTVEQGALVPSISEAAWLAELERRGGPELAARRAAARAEYEARREAHYAAWGQRREVTVSAELVAQAEAVRAAHYAAWETRRAGHVEVGVGIDATAVAVATESGDASADATASGVAMGAGAVAGVPAPAAACGPAPRASEWVSFTGAVGVTTSSAAPATSCAEVSPLADARAGALVVHGEQAAGAAPGATAEVGVTAALGVPASVGANADLGTTVGLEGTLHQGAAVSTETTVGVEVGVAASSTTVSEAGVVVASGAPALPEQASVTTQVGADVAVSLPGEWATFEAGVAWAQPSDAQLRAGTETEWSQPWAARLDPVAVSAESQVAVGATSPPPAPAPVVTATPACAGECGAEVGVTVVLPALVHLLSHAAMVAVAPPPPPPAHPRPHPAVPPPPPGWR